MYRTSPYRAEAERLAGGSSIAQILFVDEGQQCRYLLPALAALATLGHTAPFNLFIFYQLPNVIAFQECRWSSALFEDAWLLHYMPGKQSELASQVQRSEGG